MLIVCIAIALLAGGPSDATEQQPVTLVLDATRAGDGFITVRERIPAPAGSFTIVYPKWIPGEHGPTGPLNDLAALRISADGVPLDWRAIRSISMLFT